MKEHCIFKNLIIHYLKIKKKMSHDILIKKKYSKGHFFIIFMLFMILYMNLKLYKYFYYKVVYAE